MLDDLEDLVLPQHDGCSGDSGSSTPFPAVHATRTTRKKTFSHDFNSSSSSSTMLPLSVVDASRRSSSIDEKTDVNVSTSGVMLGRPRVAVMYDNV